nr:amidohydrolase [Cyclobacteriaceae bacterium]
MRILTLLLSCLVFFTMAQKQKISPNKALVVQSIDKHTGEMTAISDKIWAAAEVAFQENQSYKFLADYAEANGFKVERGVADIPTAFVATFGSGKPVI